ncbi:outer membrane beta-barrel protein [Fulvivirga sedimenti]|uniref:Outer membrane beta-barrel protein n=1 Tax=Fulvivirga sedimenti TaxID=2879465 RepID=A0A9X1KXF9_9BACT|nr:outer membrane beta-barrel protein [Fulvivirga sedimenti]MCA6074573.1 outer membrane beta-barrel protein [Fulvivirga sedimenti]MCA6075750.1 outer membrane beta-barrel protein [Fulvivirga sedimenti]MCA6076878.1 outer membrane beta-barrel protein [Fulvivirga sedimenti]
MNKSFILLAILYLCGQSLFSQVNVSGVIKGNDQVLPGATVQFRLVKDTTITTFASSNAKGNYEVKLPEDGFYKLQVSFIGYQPFTRILRITGPDYRVPDIQLVEQTELLKEVRITDKPIVVVQQGDTTAFLASGFKTNPDATAGDLLKKMPGVVVDGNGVQAQGESVQRILVDGREFFGNDPAATLRNLPADVIEKIEVFDQLSEQAQFSGYDDGNTVKTINIVTKPETRNGSFGRVYAGGGTDAHYNLGGNINFFNDQQRISIVGLSNDINLQNFSSEDLVGVASSSSSGRGRGGGNFGGGRNNGANNFLTSQQNGISQVNSFGINYVDEFLNGDLKLSASYFFNHATNTNDQKSLREYFLSADSSYFYEQNSIQDNVNYNHRFNSRIQYSIDKKNMLIVTPALSLQNNTNQLTTSILTSNMADELISGSENMQLNDLQGINFSNNLVFRHAFERRGQTLSFGLRNSYLKSDGNIDLNAINYYNRTTVISDTLAQETDRFSLQKSVQGNVTYTDRLGEKFQLQLTQTMERRWNESDNKNYDLRSEERELNPELSNVFESIYTTYTSTAGLSYRGEIGSVRAGLAYEHARLENEQLFPQTDQLTRSFNNILPTVSGRFNLTEDKNLRFFYRTNTDAPSISQLQNVIDNSNPLILTTGNPALDQAYSHRLVVRYSNSNQQSSASFFGFISAQTAANYISNETIIAENEDILVGDYLLRKGSQITRPVNLDGYWNVRSLLTYSIPSILLKSIINVNAGINYNKIPGLINEQSNTSNNYGFSAGIVIASNISERVDFNIGYSGNFNIVDNSIQPELNTNYLNSSFSAGLNWIFGQGWVFRTDINYQRYDGLSEGFNQNYALWNASLGKKFMADDRAEVSLRVFDILKQNQSITRTVTETYIEDATSVVLQQYVMLNFMYRIRNFKTTQ